MDSSLFLSFLPLLRVPWFQIPTFSDFRRHSMCLLISTVFLGLFFTKGESQCPQVSQTHNTDNSDCDNFIHWQRGLKQWRWWLWWLYWWQWYKSQDEGGVSHYRRRQGNLCPGPPCKETYHHFIFQRLANIFRNSTSGCMECFPPYASEIH